MSIKEKIKQDLKQAMKEKDKIKLDTLRGILASFTNELISQGRKPTDELDEKDQISVIKRLVKQRKDSIEQFSKNNRADLAEKEEKELEILINYMPEQASEEQIKKAAEEIMQKEDVKNSGMLIGKIIKYFDGNVDGALVKEIVEEIFKN